MTELDESLTLHALGPNEWKAHADPRREALSGMFGGWVAALLLKSLIEDARAEGTPSALTMHYFKQTPPGSELMIHTRLVSAGRSLCFWQAELSVSGVEGTAALATAVLARRKESDGFTDLAMPDAPEPDSLPEFHPPGTFGQSTLVRPVMGHPAFNRTDTRSIAWVREISGRSLDHVQLAYLSDNYAPRVFFTSPGPRPFSTLTLSIYFHASEAELRDLGDDYVLIDARGSRAEASTVGSRVNLWSRKGMLLVTTEQLGWFK